MASDKFKNARYSHRSQIYRDYIIIQERQQSFGSPSYLHPFFSSSLVNDATCQSRNWSDWCGHVVK
jgi:hypothetical protein